MHKSDRPIQPPRIQKMDQHGIKFERIYRYQSTIDQKLINKLFIIVQELNTNKLLQFSINNQIPLDFLNEDGECLIHTVINIIETTTTPEAKLNIIKFLVQHNVNPDTPNKLNQTPLHLACASQLDKIIQYLLSINVNPNYQDNLGQTPFHYLLTGKTKLLEFTEKSNNFIQKYKMDYNQNNQELINIKKYLWEFIKIYSDKLPLLDTIKYTIVNILNEDDEFIKKKNEIINLITNVLSGTLSNKLNDIKKIIDINKNTITKKLDNLFNNFFNLSNFEIHKKEPNSWSPIESSNIALIKEGDIKKTLKKNIHTSYSNIKKLYENYNIIQIDEYLSTYFLNVNIKLYLKENIKYIGEYNISNHYLAYINDQPFEPDPKNNKPIRYSYAPDNASSAINYIDLKYIGSPRLITIIYPDGDNIYSDLLYIMRLPNENKQILYLLLGNELLDDEYTRIQNLDDNDFNIYNICNQFDFNQNRFYPGINRLEPLPIITHQQAIDRKYFVILAFIAIQNAKDFINTWDEIGRIHDSHFFNKWYQLYLDNDNISSWLFNMWCDLMGKFSNNNLNCTIPLHLLMLINSLYDRTVNILQSIINAYKPCLINQLFINNNNQLDIIMSKWILLLLNDDVTLNFLNSIMENHRNLDFLNLVDKNKEIAILLYNYVKKIEPSKETQEGQYFYSYKIDDLTNSETLCRIIILLYLNSNTKILKQTFIDTIYYIKLLEFYEIENYNDYSENFKYISPIHIKNNINQVKEKISEEKLHHNIQPSLYSFLNYQLDDSDLSLSHCITSHFLGLYYEGLFHKLNFNGEPITIIIDNNNRFLSLAIKRHYGVLPELLIIGEFKREHSNHQAISTDNRLFKYNIPLPLNYLFLENAAIINEPLRYSPIYYKITQDNMHIPTNNAYYLLVINRIHYYKKKIQQELFRSIKIIEEILKGSIKNIKYLYTTIYPKITLYSKILDNFIGSNNKFMNEQKQNSNDKHIQTKFDIVKNIILEKFDIYTYVQELNNINMNYYLYHFLYSPDKLINLTKFNYYQLPINHRSRFLYFDDQNVNNDLLYNNTLPDPILTDLTPNTSLIYYNKGVINSHNIGNYNEIFLEYYNNKFPTIFKINNLYLTTLKKSKVPPSLYSALDKLYQYSLIEIVKMILIEIAKSHNIDNSNAKQIYDKLTILVNNLNIKIDNQTQELIKYNILCNLIQDIIKQEILVYKNNSINEIYKNIVTKIELPEDIYTELHFLFNQNIEINLSLTNIDLNLINETQWDEYYKFIIYRNTWTKLHSDYYWVSKTNNIDDTFKFSSEENWPKKELILEEFKDLGFYILPNPYTQLDSLRLAILFLNLKISHKTLKVLSMGCA